MKEVQLRNYLSSVCIGKERAARGAKLAQYLQTSEKEVQKLVAKLRRKGVPIASGPEGYYFASNASEVYTTIRQLREMEKGLQFSIQGLERALDDFTRPGGRVKV